MDIPSSTKPVSLGSAIADAHMRIDYLCKICKALVLEAEPEKRAFLTKLVRTATRHGNDEEFDDA